MGLPLEFTL